MGSLSNSEIELDLLLLTIYRKFGYDFRQYTRPLFKRRLMRFIEQQKFDGIIDLIKHLLCDPHLWPLVLEQFSIGVTELFRDPGFFKAFRKQVIPFLKTHPYLRIWHAGCSTGEEVYSLAIILKEENLLDRTLLYATDLNQTALNCANYGEYSICDVSLLQEKYKQCGGKKNINNFIYQERNSVKIKENLKNNIIFSKHNLVSDGVFNDMNVILCRNVLIYFEPSLQEKCIQLFDQSLIYQGFFCLGSKESLVWSNKFTTFKKISSLWNIYKKSIDFNSSFNQVSNESKNLNCR